MKSVVSAAVQSLGYDVVKPEQEIALLSFLRGQDVFVSLPTGYGKSLCYAALPAAFDSLKNSPGKSIVIAVSPLIHTIASTFDTRNLSYHQDLLLNQLLNSLSPKQYSGFNSLHTGTTCLVATLESGLMYDPIARLVPHAQPRQKDAALVDIATHKASR